jgi:predicted ATPase/class 3 adenylate cyclase
MRAALTLGVTATWTFLFTDIEGSTRLLEHLGEAEYAAVLTEHHRLIRDALAANDGEEVGTQGDGFFAVFASPRACIAAVIEMQRALVGWGWPAGVVVRVRMGVHCGEASRTAAGLVGFDVHRAARIAAVAYGSQVVVSSTAAALVEGVLPAGASLRDLGLHRLKDLGRPEQIFQLQAEGLPRDFPPLRSLDNPALLNNLPAQLATFVGRERESAEVRHLVEGKRLVTLTGTGGAGKTRLGLQVAAELVDSSGDGVWFVELAPISDENAVARTVLDALRLAKGSDRSPLEIVVESLVSQRALIVLDNCEHVIGACAKVADAVLRGCPQVHLLATSREPLGIAGETIYRVPSLSLPDPDDDGEPTLESAERSDAVALFANRAWAQGVGFVLDSDSVPLVVRICRRLDGLPLAIELAASRVRALSLASIDDRLDQRFRLLTSGNRNALPRQQTLLATVAWSWSLLVALEQALLGRLSVFVDGFDFEAVEAVCGLDDTDVFEVTDLLASLVDKSLVAAEPLGGDVRYRLLETIRQFAAERLIEWGEAEVAAVRDAHCRHFLSVAERARPRLNGPDQANCLLQLDAEQGNLKAAIEHAAGAPEEIEGTERVLRFGAALGRYWTTRNRREEAIGVLIRVLERPEAQTDPALRGSALVTAAMAGRAVDITLAERLALEAVEIARKVDEDSLFVDAGMAACSVFYFAGMPEKGLSFGEDAVERARLTGDDTLLGPSIMFLLLCSDVVHPERTDDLITEALACAERAGDENLARILHNNAGVHRLRQGDLPSARFHLLRAMDASTSTGPIDAIPLINLGWVLHREGDASGAAGWFQQALRDSRRSGDANSVAYATLGLACLASDAGEWRRSAILHGFSDAIMNRTGEPWQDPEGSYRQRSLDVVRTHLGDTAFDQGRADGNALDLGDAEKLAVTQPGQGQPAGGSD